MQCGYPVKFETVFTNMTSKTVIFALFVVAFFATANSRDFHYKSGCHKGYCWVQCYAAGWVVFKSENDWCYSTKGSSQDYKYVKCKSATECRSDWNCAGACTV